MITFCIQIVVGTEQEIDYSSSPGDTVCIRNICSAFEQTSAWVNFVSQAAQKYMLSRKKDDLEKQRRSLFAPQQQSYSLLRYIQCIDNIILFFFQIGFLGICGKKYPIMKGPNKIGRDKGTCQISISSGVSFQK